jgi:hypothetical protein
MSNSKKQNEEVKEIDHNLFAYEDDSLDMYNHGSQNKDTFNSLYA